MKVLFTQFIAEMGDKTQLMLVAMTSRFKLKDILLGTGVAVLVLNGLAVLAGGIISTVVPTWLIRLIAGAAFLFFAVTTLKGDDDEEENVKDRKIRFAPLSVFCTFFVAELGDKTQLTAITFGANEGLSSAVVVWFACSLGLFAADVIGLLIGMLICMAVFYKNQHNRPYRRHFLDIFREFNIRSARNWWYIKLTLVVSTALLIFSLLELPRAMWAGIACMSVCLPFSSDIIERAKKRGPYNIAGCLIFIVLYYALPAELHPYIGIIGGIGVGYSAGYAWQTVFNTFGALSIAAGLFGVAGAVALRIGANVFGSIYTVLFDKAMNKIVQLVDSRECRKTV